MNESKHANLRRLRTEEREELEFGTVLRDGDGAQIEFVMRNVSHGGFMGDCERPLAPGAEVVLELPAIGPLPATVKWSKGRRIGCRLRHGLKFRQIFFLLLLSCREEVEREKDMRGSATHAA